MYSYYGYPSDSKDEQSYRLLRLGTIFHEDMERALDWYRGKGENMYKEIYIEEKIEYEEFDVVGTFDAGDMDNGTFNLYDFKTAAAYKWTTKFGLKKNRNPTTDTNYKLQLGTYALGVKERFNPDKINMYLIWYNKNTSQMREQIVSNEWIGKAEFYWNEIYCQFYSICPSTLADKKPRY